MEWAKVDAATAQSHRLYGIGGWLLVIIVLFGLNVVSSVISLLTFLFVGPPTTAPGMEMAMAPQMGLLDIVSMLIGLGFAVYALYLLLIRSELVVRQLPQLFLIVYGVSVVLMLLSGLNSPMGMSGAFFAIIIGGIATAIMYLYFTRSRRVHVTFAHEVTQEEAAAA